MTAQEDDKKKIWERYFGHLTVMDYDKPLTCNDCWGLVNSINGWGHIKWHESLFDDIYDLLRERD